MDENDLNELKYIFSYLVDSFSYEVERDKKSELMDENPFMIMAPRIIDTLRGKSVDFPRIKRNLDYTGKATGIDLEEQTVNINGKNIAYEKLVIATGHSQKYDFINGSKYIHGFSG